ncbi:MAG: CIA30 family protein, partial [Bacteroidota bacterium]
MQLLLFTILLSIPATMTLFDFTPDGNIEDWRVVDDGVMGGLSQGRFSLSEEGHGYYRGYVSLANNGGFSSLRYRMPTIKVEGFTNMKIRLKGDGKRYQLRLKSDAWDRHSYKGEFVTTGEWEEVSIPLAELSPTFRGRSLNMANYPVETLTEVALLIGNKEEEDFA